MRDQIIDVKSGAVDVPVNVREPGFNAASRQTAHHLQYADTCP